MQRSRSASLRSKLARLSASSERQPRKRSELKKSRNDCKSKMKSKRKSESKKKLPGLPRRLVSSRKERRKSERRPHAKSRRNRSSLTSSQTLARLLSKLSAAYPQLKNSTLRMDIIKI